MSTLTLVPAPTTRPTSRPETRPSSRTVAAGRQDPARRGAVGPAQGSTQGSARATTQASTQGSVRLTRRGRWVVVVAGLLMIMVAGFFLGAGSAATDRPGEPEVTHAVVVGPGDTLWDIAADASPDGDVRAMMDEISELNRLGSGMLMAGQTLRVPGRG